MKVKYLILGGGPSGLAFASRLKQAGETSFLLLEKENEVGGLCRSIEVDNAPLDIGGGHFLDTRRKSVLDFVFGFMPEDEWQIYDRISKIHLRDFEIDYPYEANIWQMPLEEQVVHLISITNAGSNKGEPLPKEFSKWITWKLGNEVADNYLLPYNSKIFANVNLDDLGTYWLYKLPNVSFEDSLRSCLYKKAFGNLPAHGQFYYPKKFGYGELFKRMKEYIGEGKILLGYGINFIDREALSVNHEIGADYIINTIPWPEFDRVSSLPAEITQSIRELKYSSIDITYRRQTQQTNSHWTYFPDRSIPYHRILYRHNFVQNSRGYWEETNSLRRTPGDIPTHFNPYAYPLNAINKPENIKKVNDWAHSQKIIGLGRWGKWEHVNSDIAIAEAMNLAEELVAK